MTDQPSTATSLLAAGKPIELNDGTTVMIKYDFLAIYFIEEAYGSLQALLDLAQKMEGEDAAASPMMGTVLDLVRFGWSPNGVRPDSPPARIAVAKLLDITRLSYYIGVASAALNEAFGPTPPPAKDANPGSRPDPTQESTGSNTGPSPHSDNSSTGSGG